MRRSAVLLIALAFLTEGAFAVNRPVLWVHDLGPQLGGTGTGVETYKGQNGLGWAVVMFQDQNEDGVSGFQRVDGSVASLDGNDIIVSNSTTGAEARSNIQYTYGGSGHDLLYWAQLPEVADPSAVFTVVFNHSDMDLATHYLIVDDSCQTWSTWSAWSAWSSEETGPHTYNAGSASADEWEAIVLMADTSPGLDEPSVETVYTNGATVTCRVLQAPAAVTLTWAWTDQGTGSLAAWSSAPGGGALWLGTYDQNDVVRHCIGGLTAETEYAFRFYAINRQGHDWSSPGTFDTLQLQEDPNRLDIESFLVSTGGVVTIDWKDIGYDYTIECASNLQNPDWLAADGTIWPIFTNRWSCGQPLDQSQMFYRVKGAARMVLIPGGSNNGTNPLGSGESHDSCWYPPTYSLSVGSFYMDLHEVTNDEMVHVMQWAYDHGRISANSTGVTNTPGNQQELLDLDPSGCRITWNGNDFGMKAAKGSGYPCVEVTWYGAVAYCNYRGEMEGLTPCYDLSDWSCDFGASGYRLPTDAEWEFAARGEAVSRRFPWGGETISHSQANYYADTSLDYDLSSGGFHPSYFSGNPPHTSPVGAFAATAYGLHDMAGNVWEWCHDWHPCYAGSYRVMRGGGWYNAAGGASGCRAGYRYYFHPTYSNSGVGFRAVLPTGQ